MIVGCKLPHGLEIEHKGQTIALNGTNVGYDGDSPWKNGVAPDSYERISGFGLTKLEGARAEAFQDWMDMSANGIGPVSSGMIFAVEKEADVKKEAQALENEKSGLDGIDPGKDLPAGLATDADTAKSGKK